MARKKCRKVKSGPRKGRCKKGKKTKAHRIKRCGKKKCVRFRKKGCKCKRR